ncbi:MAG: LamG-like jellyroll fold domain-containing protein [Nitrososphaeraceae archaeon]
MGFITIIFIFSIFSVDNQKKNSDNFQEIYAQTTTFPDFNFAAAGDWGCNSNTDATVNSIVNQGTEITLGLGDYSYQSSASCFLNKVNSIDENMKIAIGNHEDSSSEDRDRYLSHFNLNSQYYSFNVQNVHFLAMATELSYGSGSSQHTFVKNDLNSASKDPNIDWIIVFLHKPMYSSPNSCSSSSCQGVSSLRDTYHPLFDQFGVDLVLDGHTHDYQRSLPIKFNPNSKSNPVITNNHPNSYNDPEGQIHAIVGTGGINFHKLTGQKSFIVSQQDKKFGHLNVAITNNGMTLNGKFVANDNTVMDQFTITKSSSTPGSEICTDGVDNDNDGLVDGADPDCQTPSTGYHYEPFFTADGNTALDIQSAPNLQLSKFTVSTWFKTTTNFPDEGVMVNKGGLGSESKGANQNYGIWFTSSERLQGGFETTGGSNKYVTTSNTYNDDQWHHGVVTFDGSIVRLFVDGTQIGTTSTSSTPDNTGNQPLRIAGNAQSLTEDFFVGQLDEVGVWNRALTTTEITNLKDNGVFPSSGLVYSNSFDSSSPPPPPPPPPPEPENCTDGVDNDNDGLVDGADPDCQTTPPPPSGDIFPIPNINWIYDSTQTLSQDATIPSGRTHPNDRVLFSSGASGVDFHQIKNGWLEIQSGGGNGRVYWNYHELPQFTQLPTAGFNTVMTGTFKIKPGIDNFSLKDGNHGTNGWILEGQLVFGGFGISFHRTDVQSKVEYYHSDHGSQVKAVYPNGLKLIDDKEYKFFISFITDRTKNQVVLNAWLDFGDGKGWTYVMKDRVWGLTGWDPGNVPTGNDKTQIENGPSFIKKHHIWTRANGDPGTIIPIKNVKIGTTDFIS